MTIDSGTRLNGVDLEAVAGLAQAITEDMSKAKTTWAAHITWTDAFASEARVRQFPATASDEPAALGGGDTAANPVEQLLSALGNCLAVGITADVKLVSEAPREQIDALYAKVLASSPVGHTLAAAVPVNIRLA